MSGPLRRALLRPLVVALSVAVGVPIAATANADPSVPEVRRKLAVAAERLHHAEEEQAQLTDDFDGLQRKIAAAERERTVVLRRKIIRMRSTL